MFLELVNTHTHEYILELFLCFPVRCVTLRCVRCESVSHPLHFAEGLPGRTRTPNGRKVVKCV